MKEVLQVDLEGRKVMTPRKSGSATGLVFFEWEGRVLVYLHVMCYLRAGRSRRADVTAPVPAAVLASPALLGVSPGIGEVYVVAGPLPHPYSDLRLSL